MGRERESSRSLSRHTERKLLLAYSLRSRDRQKTRTAREIITKWGRSNNKRYYAGGRRDEWKGTNRWCKWMDVGELNWLFDEPGEILTRRCVGLPVFFFRRLTFHTFGIAQMDSKLVRRCVLRARTRVRAMLCVYALILEAWILCVRVCVCACLSSALVNVRLRLLFEERSSRAPSTPAGSVAQRKSPISPERRGMSPFVLILKRSASPNSMVVTYVHEEKEPRDGEGREPEHEEDRGKFKPRKKLNSRGRT